MKDFVKGLIAGFAISGMIIFLYSTFSMAAEYGGYKDKLVIEYHCTEKEYNRKIILDMMKESGMQTNFINKECTMDKYRMRYRFTNPQ